MLPTAFVDVPVPNRRLVAYWCVPMVPCFLWPRSAWELCPGPPRRNGSQLFMAFVSVTRLHIRSVRYFPQFMLYALRSARQVRRSAGFLGGRLVRDTSQAFWTVTVWEDAMAMDAYRTTGAHRAAMPKLLNWCDEASVAHWTQDSNAVPNWEEAHHHMITGGRPSKVNRPSAAQDRHDIPALKPTPFAMEIRPR